MADLDDIKDGKDWGIGIPAKNEPFFSQGLRRLGLGDEEPSDPNLQSAQWAHGDAGL